MMRLQEMQPKDLIEPLWLNEYGKEITAIWWQLVRLSSNLFIMEKIVVFPFDLFLVTPSPFWKATFDGLFEMSIMIIWRVAIDKRKEVLTINRLSDNILEHLQTETYRKQFEETLTSIGFEKAVTEIKNRLIKLRHNYIAHFNREYNVNPEQRLNSDSALYLKDLTKLAEVINSLFNQLCFGHGRGVILQDLIDPAGSDKRSDIEKLLDDIAKNSALLNAPEIQPFLWPYLRQKMSLEKVETMNYPAASCGVSKVKTKRVARYATVYIHFLYLDF